MMEIMIKNSNVTFNSGNIYGLYGGNANSFDKVVSKNLNGRFRFFLKKRKIVIIDPSKMKFNTENIKSEINYVCKLNNFYDKSFKKTIEKYIMDFGFSVDDFDKKISEMSYSQKILFCIFINTLFDFDVIFFKNVLPYLDKKNHRIINNLLAKLKSENKSIYLYERDINVLYNFSDYLVYFYKKNMLYCINKKEYYEYFNELINNGLDVPDKLYLIYLAKKEKKVKLTYLDDVRDIIKDIYKHV